MHIDHFRPMKHFPHLSSDPYNLLLSCPKCNVLKSDDWPCEKVDTHPGYDGLIGYLNPFDFVYAEYLEVDRLGYIRRISGPIEYMVEKMQLNRASRCQIRRRRVVQAEKDLVSGLVTSRLKELLQMLEDEEVAQEIVREKLAKVILLKTQLDALH